MLKSLTRDALARLVDRRVIAKIELALEMGRYAKCGKPYRVVGLDLK